MHLFVVWNSADHKFYVYKDGIQKGSAPISNNLNVNPTNDLGIGRYAGANYFNGTIDDARIYNRALSPDEVKQMSEYGPGPVGWWKMDENVSGNSKTLVDSSGNGNNATTYYGANATGMDCTGQGKFGGGCKFDGADDYVNAGAGSSLDIVNSVTLEAWIKPDTLAQSANPEIISKGGAAIFYRMRFMNGGYMKFNAYGTSDGTLDSSIMTAGVWHHIEMVYDGATKKIYIDGKLDAQEATTGKMDGAAGADLFLGGFSGSERFAGSIDDVRVYNYARTSKQIVEDMNGGHPAPGSPVGSALIQLKFDEGQGATANNSGNGGSSKNGTMTPQGGGQTQTYQMWDNSGKFNRAADLDGTDDYVSIPDFSY